MFLTLLSLLRCVYRANTGTSSTVDASISIDDIDSVSLRDSLYRALSSTSSACDASISNLISHFISSYIHIRYLTACIISNLFKK